MLKKILHFFKAKSVPCNCGGSVTERVSMAGFDYGCQRCGQTMQESEFVKKLAKAKPSEGR